MIGLAKRVLSGTRWEEPAKRLVAGISGHKNSLYDWQTIAIMRRVLRRDSTAIDVGAFDGGMLRHMVRLAPDGRHWAFEPQPERHARLVERFPSIRVLPHAIGAEPGSATFHCMLDHPALSGLRRRFADEKGERVREIEVSVESLDHALPSDLPIDFVKIDIEGGELGAFQGGIQTLRRTKPVVVFECGIGGADYFNATPDAVHEVVRETGLRISTLNAWLSGAQPLSRPAFVDQFEKGENFYFVAHP